MKPRGRAWQGRMPQTEALWLLPVVQDYLEGRGKVFPLASALLRRVDACGEPAGDLVP
jgi:hypothetical protein